MAAKYQQAEAARMAQPVLCCGDVTDPDEKEDEDEENDLQSAAQDATITSSSEDEDDNEDESDDFPEGRSSKNTDMPKRGIFSRSEKVAYYGFVAQYFAVGIIYGGIPATVYPVFLGYLNVPAYVYATVAVISSLPWSFKFFFGMINDTVPIMGLRRKPYMMIGWTMCAAVLIILYFTPLPPPYWCIDDVTGEYIKKKTLPDGSHHAADPCNAEAAVSGGRYTVLMMLAALGYVIADVAADGLTTEYAKAEPMERRGSTQTTAYLTRTIGQACSSLFVGLFMNSKNYNGSFDWGLSFEQVCLCFAVPAVIMVPVSALMVHEPQAVVGLDGKKGLKCGEYFSMCWDLIKSKAFFYAILYMFLSPVIGGISTTASSQVKINWAGVENFQNQMFSLVGNLLFIVGLWLVKTRYLNTSWRKLLMVTMIFLNVVDAFFSTLTIFAVVRNQYFYLGETVLTEIPSAANFVVSTFIIVEMADDGNEGLVYGLMTTAGNLGSPFARAIGNQIYRYFTPSLSSADNYIEDTQAFRWTVFNSFLLSYGFAFASLGMLYFLPRQKAEAQERKKTWPRHPIYGYITIVMLSIALIYSLTVNFMSMRPSTMCMEFAGGDGCDLAPVTPPMLGNSSNASNASARLLLL